MKGRFIIYTTPTGRVRENGARFAMSLDRLATLYQAQGKYADAEPLYKRELANFEKSLGPEHLQLAKSPWRTTPPCFGRSDAAPRP